MTSTPPLSVRYSPEGMFIPEIDLWLDPRVPVQNAWFSHAHSDHATGRPTNVWATLRTLKLYRLRWPETIDIVQSLKPLAWGEPNVIQRRNIDRLASWPHRGGSSTLCGKRRLSDRRRTRLRFSESGGVQRQTGGRVAVSAAYWRTAIVVPAGLCPAPTKTSMGVAALAGVASGSLKLICMSPETSAGAEPA